MIRVYVKWYGKVLDGELLEGEHLGMKQVRIPLDGHHPIALFSPGHVYETVEQMQEIAKEVYIYPKEFPKPSDIIHIEPSRKISDILTIDRQSIEAFKQANWDHERGHLRIDKLDEFYQLWRMIMKPDGIVEAEAPVVTLPSHKPGPVITEATHKTCTPIFQPQSLNPVSKNPAKKMRCWTCEYLDYDHLDCKLELRSPGEHFCGLHGRAPVNPDGNQVNLNNRGSCGYFPRKKALQLSLFD